MYTKKKKLTNGISYDLQQFSEILVTKHTLSQEIITKQQTRKRPLTTATKGDLFKKVERGVTDIKTKSGAHKNY